MNKNKSGGYISVNRDKALKENWDMIQRLDRPANKKVRAKRRKNDFYPTPSSVTKELLEHIDINCDDTCIEPCAGNNDITNELQKEFCTKIRTNDIDTNHKGHDTYLHAADSQLYGSNREHLPDWVITNPPFSDAIGIVQNAYIHANIGIAMLLRLSFLEPTKDRGPWLAEHPPTKILVLPRISFTGDGKTDSMTCAWMIWEKDSTKQEIKVINSKYVDKK